MKILTSHQIRAVDAFTIEREPISSIDLMERAACACVDWFIYHFDTRRKVAVFAGYGNNGGDGLAIARLLRLMNYDVSVYMLAGSENLSPDALTNYQRLTDVSSLILTENKLPELHPSAIVIDALFGTGLSRPLEGCLAVQTVAHINKSGCTVVSVDIPSGLFCDDNSQNNPENIIRAHHTLTFQQPKLSFFFAENADFVGNWEVLDIGLLPEAIEKQKSKYFVLQKQDAGNIPLRHKFAHKGDFGHVCLIAGSYGMMGACVLATKACLRTGAGLVTAHIPQKGNDIVQISVPEALVSLDENSEVFSKIPDLSRFSAIGVGCGIGKKPETQQALFELLQAMKGCSGKLVLDADALNILSENPEWLKLLPPDSILTPHPKEFDRLAGISENSYQRHLKQIEMAQKYSVIIVLKGAHTLIAVPDGRCFFNTTGNPGMATGGSGDVLTGIIVSLLAQGWHPVRAACTGVWLHGEAGDKAVLKRGQQALIAGDIIKNIR